MNKLSLDWPQGAASLLSQARQVSASDGELLRLILAETHNLDSWLIENRILPALREKGFPMLRFTLRIENQEARSAKLLPLPDGSALACTADGLWSAFEVREAVHEIAYIGYRYAPSKHWQDAFQAMLQLANGSERPLTPAEVAGVWREATGGDPAGYASGAIDHLQALASELLDKAFNTQGRLGL
ncbi:hypothetical protein ACCAA_920032 [Candidatus Accumulibacter aalborgensis]|uniref:Uncharacterized protein n=1 Tax=Candidatus Accumulibacter aalborgensis TaxID=1860102 RepID=A0A1A8XZW5_9PROT|nr:hypothetical protein [Candidatus Accumulibacter aalborgensis]SBT10256.1 hypothetical protein ACCAA_920032 [Candidatus Accumulibacter aalborgensis]